MRMKKQNFHNIFRQKE